MLQQMKYTEKEMKQILSNICVLCDTREQIGAHIKDYLTSKKIQFEDKKLDFGDYSFKLLAVPELGIHRELHFEKSIFVERKNSLEELCNNFAEARLQFENEWLRAKDARKILVIEKGSYKDIFDGRYNTLLRSNSFLASLFSFQMRYKIEVAFVSSEHSARYIYMQFYYFLMELLK